MRDRGWRELGGARSPPPVRPPASGISLPVLPNRPRRGSPGTPLRPPPLGTGAALGGISGPPRRGCGTGAALRSLRAALGSRSEPRLPGASASRLGWVSGRPWAEALLEERGVPVPRAGGGRGGKGRRVGQRGQRPAGTCPVLLPASPGTEPLPPETTGALGSAGPSRWRTKHTLVIF